MGKTDGSDSLPCLVASPCRLQATFGATTLEDFIAEIMEHRGSYSEYEEWAREAQCEDTIGAPYFADSWEPAF